MTLSRRRLVLGGGGGLALAGCAAGAGAGAAAAAAAAAPADTLRRRLAGLRIGANLERWYTIGRDQQARRLGPDWWRGFRAAGFDHARLFVPKLQETGDSEEVLRQFLEATQDANRAGLPVLLGLSDTYYHSNPWTPAEWRALARRAAYFGPRTDPAQVVLAPLNEPAFPDWPSWRPVRDRLLAEVRSAAPRHLLMWGGHEWCSWRSLPPATPPEGDPNTIAEVHDYQGGAATAQVRDRFAPVAAWRDRHGLPVLVAELGGDYENRASTAGYAADLGRILPALRALRLPAALWSYSHGGHWRLQAGDGPALRPELRAVVAEAARGGAN
jgi:hypothetical protein